MVPKAVHAHRRIANERPHASQRTVPNAAARNNVAMVAWNSEAVTLSMDKLREIKSAREITKSTRAPTTNNVAVTSQFEY